MCESGGSKQPRSPRKLCIRGDVLEDSSTEGICCTCMQNHLDLVTMYLCRTEAVISHALLDRRDEFARTRLATQYFLAVFPEVVMAPAIPRRRVAMASII